MTQPAPSSPPPVYNASREVAKGVSWALLMRWAIRFIGLFSTLILARLLSPGDFGVAAMGMLVVGFLFEFTEFGAGIHLIRAKEIDQAHCDSAWTITLLQNLFIALALVATAHSVAAYFKEPRVVEVMYLLALGSFIAGFENIGPTLIRRELKFGLDFRFNVYKKLLILVTTIGCAIYFRNYWALVLGHLAGTAAGVVLSYFIHPYRPSFSLARAPEYLRFGLAIIPMRIANVLRTMAPRVLVGGLGSATAMGSFTVSSSLATMFTEEIVQPMGRGLYPNYARLANDRVQLSAVYRKVIGLVTFLCIPIGVGMSAVADDMVAVVLGPQWEFAAVLIQYLSIGGVIYAVSHTMYNQILVATGREKRAALLAWVRLGITVPVLAFGLHQGEVLGLAQATIAAPLLCLPLIYLETRRAVDLPRSAMVGILWRPIVGALVMYVVVKVLHLHGVQWAAVRLAWDISIGALVYGGVTLALWRLSGGAEGAESMVVNLLGKGRYLVQGRWSQSS